MAWPATGSSEGASLMGFRWGIPLALIVVLLALMSAPAWSQQYSLADLRSQGGPGKPLDQCPDAGPAWLCLGRDRDRSVSLRRKWLRANGPDAGVRQGRVRHRPCARGAGGTDFGWRPSRGCGWATACTSPRWSGRASRWWWMSGDRCRRWTTGACCSCVAIS